MENFPDCFEQEENESNITAKNIKANFLMVIPPFFIRRTIIRGGSDKFQFVYYF